MKRKPTPLMNAMIFVMFIGGIVMIVGVGIHSLQINGGEFFDFDQLSLRYLTDNPGLGILAIGFVVDLFGFIGVFVAGHRQKASAEKTED